ncbi:MAG: energy transducer TonB [Flavobacteriia bacterium]
MGVILSIVFVIAGVLVYDYFTARRWQQVTSGVRNDIVFANRNKEYGAYVIRRDNDKHMVLIMGGLILLMAIAFGIFKFIQSIPEEVVDIKKNTSQVDFKPAPALEDVPPPPPPPPTPPMEEIVKFLPPVITNDAVEDEIKLQDELEDKKTGAVDQKGDPNAIGDGILGEPEPDKTEPEPEKPAEVFTFVEEEAKFNGDMNEYIVKKLVYPPDAIDLGLQGRCYLKFVVEVDGQVSNVSVVKGVPDCPQCDKEAIRVVKSMPNWKPGKNGGKAVRVWCQIPLNFTLH